MYKCQDIWACALDINPQIKVEVRINEAGNVYMKAVIAAWF